MPIQSASASPNRTASNAWHLLLRIGLWIVVTYVFNSFLLLAGPVISAVLVAQRGTRGFHERYGEIYGKVVAFMMGLLGYMFFASDEFPEWGEGGALRYDYTPTGEPTVGSALLRIVMVIPHVIALWFVGILALALGFVAAVTVLFSQSVPHGVWKFLMGYVAWEARVCPTSSRWWRSTRPSAWTWRSAARTSLASLPASRSCAAARPARPASRESAARCARPLHRLILARPWARSSWLHPAIIFRLVYLS